MRKFFSWLILFLFLYAALGFSLRHRVLSAAEPVRSWEIWHDDAVKLYKVQDGSCTLYLSRGYENAFGGGATTAMVAGQGCR